MKLKAEVSIELWDAVSRQYETENYANAILEALHYLRDLLRESANVDGDGTALAGQALGGNPPRLRINKLETESEKDEQKGFEQIVRGLYQGIRNPRTHDKLIDRKETADSIIVFVNYLTGVISKAKGPFVLDEWLKRVFDTDFVAKERYVQLLVSDVPPKRRADALVAIYRKKIEGDGGELALVFQALINQAEETELEGLFAAISDELKIETDEAVIRTALQLLPPNIWPKIDEAARIRIENKLIKSIQQGSVNSLTRKCEAGAFGTWARDYCKYFTSTGEVYYALARKLEGDEGEQSYVAQFFWSVLPYTLETPVSEQKRENWSNVICKGVSKRFASTMLREKLIDTLPRFPDDWRNLIIEKLKPLENEDPDFYSSLISDENESIPF